MAIFHGTSIPTGATEDYLLEKSCRFNDDDSASMNRTFGTPTNAKIGTLSFWCKLGKTTDESQAIMQEHLANKFWVGFDNNGSGNYTLGVYLGNNGTKQVRNTTRLFRDHNNWYHITLAIDTTDGSASERLKLYVNGELVTDFTTNNTINQNIDVFTNVVHYIASYSGGSELFDGYLAEVNFIDGQKLGAENFGVTGDYGEWKPIEYTGSYGNNGFRLDFANSGSLGNDVSGNGNNFTATNIAAHDQMLDTPTNNYCTMSPIDDSPMHKGLFKNGNLELYGSLDGNPWGGGYNFQGGQVGTHYTNKKLYYEIYVGGNASNWMAWGIAPDDYHPSYVGDRDMTDSFPGKTHNLGTNHGWSYYLNTTTNHWDGSSTSSVAHGGVGNGTIVMVAFDPATGKCWWGKNGTWMSSGNPTTGANPWITLSNLSHANGRAHTWTGWWGSLDGGTASPTWAVMNFGQDSTFGGRTAAGGNSDDNEQGNFKYAVPTGFLALCKNNMDDPAIIPSDHFNTVLYAGSGSSQTITTGLDNDLVWVKNRGRTSEHVLVDTIRGDGKVLHPDLANQENTPTGAPSLVSTGFTVSSNDDWYNRSGDNYVNWSWKGGTSVSGSTAGSGTSKSYTGTTNTDAGFSIISFEGNGTSGHAIPHHLSQAPTFIITKRRSGGNNSWNVGQFNVGYNWTGTLYMENTEPWSSENEWGSTAPTSTHFTTGSSASSNASGSPYIAYCFHDVEGYSKIGGYYGTGNTDGTFVYTGFKPSFILLKSLSVSGSWVLTDLIRNPINDGAMTNSWAEDRAAENANDYEYDFLSNGFKFRTGSQNIQSSGNKYMYYAVAEQPFKYSNAH